MNSRFGILVLGVLIICYVLIAWFVFDPSSDPTSTYLYLYLFGIPLVACTLLAITRRDPIEFLLLVIIFLLPFVGMFIPPRRYNISFLTIISFGVALLILYRKITKRENIDLFPYKLVLIPILLLIPSVLLSETIIISITCFFVILGYYALFIGFNHYLKKNGWPEKFLYGLIFSLLLASFMIIFEKVSGINPSLSHHPREVASILGISIQRSSGVFQDPQKAAQFIAVLSVFLLILVSRKSIINPKMKTLCIITLIISLPALVITITRASIYSAALVGVMSLLFLNRFNLLGKLFLWLGVALITIMFSLNLFHNPLPKSLTARMEKSKEHAEGRMQIWKDSWYIFEVRPMTGIGLGAYQTYLIKTSPGMKRLAQMGLVKRVPNMPESGYLKILYEAGIIGSFGVIFIFFAIFCASLRLLLSSGDNHMRSFIYASVMGGVVYLGGFLTIYTASDSRNAILPIILFLIIIHSSRYLEQNS